MTVSSFCKVLKSFSNEMKAIRTAERVGRKQGKALEGDGDEEECHRGEAHREDEDDRDPRQS